MAAATSSNRTMHKIATWNVNAIKMCPRNGAWNYLMHQNVDIICLQATYMKPTHIPENANLRGYHNYWYVKPAPYSSGIAIYSKKLPIAVEYGIGDPQYDEQARVLIAEYENFILVCVFALKPGYDPVKLDKRLQWNVAFRQKINQLNNRKPVIIAGDMGVAHKEIDWEKTSSNLRISKYIEQGRDDMSTLLADGYVDCFRHLYPNATGAYTFWARSSCRERNIGRRLDYFLVSERLVPRIVDCVHKSDILGSNHCPIVLSLNI